MPKVIASPGTTARKRSTTSSHRCRTRSNRDRRSSVSQPATYCGPSSYSTAICPCFVSLIPHWQFHPANRDLIRRVDANTNGVCANAENYHLDQTVDDDCFLSLPCQNELGIILHDKS